MYCTVAETKEFSHRAERLLNVAELDDLIEYLSACPLAGVLVPGAGGVRKLRWSRGHKGRSGGVRIIYFYFNEDSPLFLLTLFGKGEKSNLTAQERNELAKVAKLIKKRGGNEKRIR